MWNNGVLKPYSVENATQFMPCEIMIVLHALSYIPKTRRL